MKVRKAELKDIDAIMQIYDSARIFMRNHGNPYQWGDNYPQIDILTEDIKNNQCFVCVENNEIAGVFAFMMHDEPCYNNIKQGRWLNNEPYGVIHRLASGGKAKGVFCCCLDFCSKQIKNIRADTHKDNIIMQHLFEKHGFLKCGIITLSYIGSRIVYHYIKSDN